MYFSAAHRQVDTFRISILQVPDEAVDTQYIQ